MPFLAWISSIVVVFASLAIYRLIRKNQTKEHWEEYLIHDLFSFGFALDLGFILAFVFVFAFPRFPFFEGFLFFLALSLTFLFFSPSFLFRERSEDEKFPIRKTACLSLLLIGLFLKRFVSTRMLTR